MFLFGPCSVFMHKLLCFLAIVSSFWRKSITMSPSPSQYPWPASAECSHQTSISSPASCLIKPKFIIIIAIVFHKLGQKVTRGPLSVHFGGQTRCMTAAAADLPPTFWRTAKFLPQTQDLRLVPPCDQKPRRGYSIRHFWLCCFYHHHKENVVIVAISNWTILYFLNRNSWCLRMSEYKGDGDNVRFLERVQIFRHDMG